VSAFVALDGVSHSYAARGSSSGGTLAVAVTGIAGPSGGSDAKPVGTVCFAFATSRRISSETRHFKGNRESVRRQSVVRALEGLLETLTRA